MSQQVTKKQKKKEAEISLGNEYLLLFYPRSTMTKCPYCLNSAPSIVEFKNGYLSYVSCFLILLIFGFIPSLLLVPFMMIITKSLIHRYENTYYQQMFSLWRRNWNRWKDLLFLIFEG